MPHRAGEVLDFIAAYIAQHEYPPSVREIAAGVGLASTGVAQHYLRRLQAQGRIARTPRQARSIRILSDAPVGLEADGPQRISPYPSRDLA